MKRKKIKKLKLVGGLRLLPKDERDFQLGNIVKLPKLEDLPESYLVETLGVNKQDSSDFCAAFATCTASETQEGIELEPTYTFALSKELSGDPDDWGQDLRTMCKSHTKIGAIEKKDSPYNLSNKDTDFLRRIENWPPELKNKAAIHRKQSYFKITGPYSHFDNIRASLFYYKTPIVIGVIWSWPLEDVFMEDFKEEGFGHAVTVCGWIKVEEKTYLIIQNSYGASVGRQGFHYFSRKIIDAMIDKFGAFCFIDLPRETAETMNKWKIKWRWLAAILAKIKF